MTRPTQRTLNRKLRLERDLLVGVKSIFDSMSSEVNRRDFNPRVYTPQIESLLSVQYLNVANTFIDDYRSTNRVVMDDLQEIMFINNLRDRLEQQAVDQAEAIGLTNLKNWRESLAIADDLDVSINKDAARVNIFKSALYRRSNAIACYETQWCAEYTKINEFQYLIGLEGISIKVKGDSTKRWDAMGDDKMRRWHADADSQVVEVDQDFQVNGDPMAYPGDRSRTQPSNYVNCRCSAAYAAKRSILTRGRSIVRRLLGILGASRRS